MSKTIGFIGLGAMGKPMALNLLKKGFALTVYDIVPSFLDLRKCAQPSWRSRG
jgi:3-hydroxyisobutyrate dehydrogenase-like beta-hydroxyacid dehydrogenase